MGQDAGVYRVRFAPLIGAENDEEQSEFTRELKSVGGMVIHGDYPKLVTIGATPDAADHIAGLSFVAGVESLGDDGAV